MDDQTQDPQIVPQSMPDDSRQDTPVVQQQHPLPQRAVPVAPVGGMNKEAGPVVHVEQPLSEVLTPSEAEPVLSPELVEAGVEVSPNPHVPDLTMHDKNAGLSHAPVIAPVPTHHSGSVQLPIPGEEAIVRSKIEKDSKKSISWYLRVVVREYLMGKEKEKGEKGGH